MKLAELIKNRWMETINTNDIHVREIQPDDLEDMRKYFFDSPAEFLTSIGLRLPQPGESEKFKETWQRRFEDRASGGPRIPVLTVMYRGERVGFHTSTHHDPQKSLIMHAHFFRSDLRGRGIGTISYVLAIEKFLTEYGYREVLFKTPKQNFAPMKIKEKLGLSSIGEEIIDWPVLAAPLLVKIFRVTKADISSLRSRAGLE